MYIVKNPREKAKSQININVMLANLYFDIFILVFFRYLIISGNSKGYILKVKYGVSFKHSFCETKQIQWHIQIPFSLFD